MRKASYYLLYPFTIANSFRPLPSCLPRAKFNQLVTNISSSNEKYYFHPEWCTTVESKQAFSNNHFAVMPARMRITAHHLISPAAPYAKFMSNAIGVALRKMEAEWVSLNDFVSSMMFSGVYGFVDWEVLKFLPFWRRNIKCYWKPTLLQHLKLWSNFCVILSATLRNWTSLLKFIFLARRHTTRALDRLPWRLKGLCPRRRCWQLGFRFTLKDDTPAIDWVCLTNWRYFKKYFINL